MSRRSLTERVIRELASYERPSASDGERRAAEWLAGHPELRRHVRSGYPLVAEQPGEFALPTLVARRAAAA